MDQSSTNPDLIAFQADLRKKFRYLVSFFSIALIIAGLYLLLNGLLALVATKGDVEQISEDAIFETLTGDGSIVAPNCPRPNINDGQENEDTTGVNDGVPSIGEGGISTVRAATSAETKAEYTSRAIMSSGKWQATDYVKGDITGDSYTVKLGDTLWEIAEAVYGSGFQWQQLLLANQNIVGFLPNGQQALIYPGQILAIP